MDVFEGTLFEGKDDGYKTYFAEDKGEFKELMGKHNIDIDVRGELWSKLQKWYDTRREQREETEVKEYAGQKRKFSDFFGDIVVHSKYMRLEYIPGLFFSNGENEEAEDDEAEEVKFDLLSMNDFPPLMHPQASSKIIMVRPCYEVIFKQLFEYVMCENPRYISENLTVTGNPGIGKSRFYVYCVHQFIQKGTNGRVLVINFDSKFQLYDSNNGEFRRLQIPGVDDNVVQNPNVLRLVEAKSTELTGWQGVSILFASPGVVGLHNYQKTLRQRKYLMPVWSFQEIQVCNEVREESLSSDELKSRFSLFGGVPRFVFGENYSSDVKKAVASNDVVDIFRFVKGKNSVRDRHYSHLLLKMCPISDSFHGEFYLDFLSDGVAKMLYSRFEEACHNELVNFMIENMNDSNTATVRGRFYEIFCHRRFMRGICLVGHNLESKEDFKLDIIEGVEVRHFTVLEDIVGLKSNEYVLFIPYSKIFGALDSFYWNGTDMFVLQVTISNSNPISHFKLCQFVTWFRNLSDGIVSFVFVVPSRILPRFQKQSYVSSKKKVMKKNISKLVIQASQYVVPCDEFGGVLE